MNALWHRGVTSVLVTLTAVSGLLSQTDPSTLNLNEVTWNYVVIVLAVATLVVQGVRQFVSPSPVA